MNDSVLHIKNKLLRTILTWCTLGVVAVSGCATDNEKTTQKPPWLIHEAPLAEGWPSLTPVGQVEIKDYPQVRAAIVHADDTSQSGGRMNQMFGQLFNHIKTNDIAMTSPVEMGYQNEQTNTMSSMAFLYRQPDMGKTGDDGNVTVENMPARTYASIGVRGNYNDKRFYNTLATLDAWLDQHNDKWLADGPPRYLGYNSPFVPSFLRYGEVQRPVKPAEE